MRERYFILSLEKAFRLLTAFGRDRPSLSLREAAVATGLNRATARRFLLTLADLGYVAQDTDGRFHLTPKVLELGSRYLEGLDLARAALPELEALTAAVGEASNVAVADGAEIVYVARVPVAHRILSVNLQVGSRLPIHATSLGKALLAGMDPEERRRRLGPEPFARYTSATRTTYAELEADLAAVARQGVAVSDGELEEGLRSIAAPIRDFSGKVVAAVNLSTHALRTPRETLLGPYREALLQAAGRISRRLGRNP